MAFHQDYMMRQIQDMVRAIMRVVGIKNANENEEVLPEQTVSEGSSLLETLKKLARGKIIGGKQPLRGIDETILLF